MKKSFPIKYTKLFIDGAYVPSLQNKTFPTINPATEEVIANISEAQSDDVDVAVKAARKAFDHGPWRRFSASQRSKLLFKLADLIQSNIDEMSYLETIDNGKAYTAAIEDIAESVNVLRYYY